MQSLSIQRRRNGTKAVRALVVALFAFIVPLAWCATADLGNALHKITPDLWLIGAADSDEAACAKFGSNLTALLQAADARVRADGRRIISLSTITSATGHATSGVLLVLDPERAPTQSIGTVPPTDPIRLRPQVVSQQQVRPSIFEDNNGSPQIIGNVGVSAQFSNYGQYLQKMIEAVQGQWKKLLTESRASPTSGATVRVVFRINRDGAVYQIIKVEGNAGEQFEKVCATAITSHSTYGAWTDEMKRVLGESQEMTFTFYYQ